MSESSVFQTRADEMSGEVQDASGSRLVRPFMVKRVPQQSHRRADLNPSPTYWQPPTKESAAAQGERYVQFFLAVAAGFAEARGEIDR